MVENLTARSPYTPGDLYGLLAEQVDHYHRHYHMGNNTSVPTEIARELLASIGYTLQTAGPGGTGRQALARGQANLAGRVEEAKRALRLVMATEWGQGSWFWDAVTQLGRWLDAYDHLHFAHRSPQLLCYPLALPVPEGVLGVDYALYYLQSLWKENQILFSFPEGAVEELHNALPGAYWDGPELLCQQPLLQAVGRVLLDLPLDTLLLGERRMLLPPLNRENVLAAGAQVCRELQLPEGPAAYARAALEDVLPRLLHAADPTALFW